MRHRAVLLALVSLISLAISSAALAGGALTDAETGISFSPTQTIWGKEWIGLGVGTRVRYGFDVYSMALYVEKERGAPALKAYVDGDGKGYASGGKLDVSKAKTDPKLARAIVDCACGRGVDIKMARAVSGPAIKKATLDALTNQIDTSAPDVKDDVQRLGDFLNYDLQVGSQLKFYFSASGKLSATGPGGDVLINNPKLSKALLANWIGPKPLQEDLRDGLLSQVNALLE